MRLSFAIGFFAACLSSIGASAPTVCAQQLEPIPLRGPQQPEPGAGIDAPDTTPIAKSSVPLPARITFNVNDLPEQEKLPARMSPILMDATRENRLSLEDVLNLAVRRNLPYVRTKWLGRQAFGTFLGSVGAMNPFYVSQNVLNLGIVNYPDNAKGQVFPINQPIDRERYGVYGVVLSNGGQNAVALFTNLFAWRAEAAVVKTSMQDALQQATSNYFDLCRQVALLHVQDMVVQNAKGITELNGALFESGMGTKLQLLQAKTQLAQYRQQLVSQQAQARLAAINIGVTLNMPLSSYILPEARPLDKTTLVDPQLTPEMLVSVSLRQRPEIVQKRNVVRQSLSQSAQALTPLLPVSSLSVQRGTFFPSDGSGSTSGIQRSLQLTWQLNNLGVPVLPNFAAGLAGARAAEIDLRNTELQVRSEVRSAFDRSQAAEANIEIAQQASIDAQEQLKLAEERLRVGIGINIDVIQAQTTLAQALENYVNAIYDYNMQQTRLRRAIGGFEYKSVQARLRYN